MPTGRTATETEGPGPAPRSPEPSRITFVGHSTVLIETAGARMLTDPLLRGRVLGFLRRRQPAPDPRALEKIDAILISHFHHDHLDMRSLRQFRGGPPIVAPAGGAKYLRSRGHEHVIELPVGESTTIGRTEVTAVKAVHGGGLARPGGGAAAFVGYVVKGTASIYFAGDTDFFDELAEIGDMGLDVALIPIWGWGAKLGSGHLDPGSAARALRLLRPKIAVPIHWGTYSPLFSKQLWPWLLHEPVSRFVERAAVLAPDVDVRVLQPGEHLDVATMIEGGGRSG
ncbi:MAG: MBL fold metallo-hydrolase [Solirubrobacterales bacterium]